MELNIFYIQSIAILIFVEIQIAPSSVSWNIFRLASEFFSEVNLVDCGSASSLTLSADSTSLRLPELQSVFLT